MVRTVATYLLVFNLDSFHPALKFLQRRPFSYRHVKQNYVQQIEKCYSVLRVSEQCSDSELRESYISLAKNYHPDSITQQANTKKFNEIDEAYRTLLEYRQNRNKFEESFHDAVKEDDFGIKHTPPQHRQFLENEGIGFGTPSERQKQYQLHQVHRAAENVLEYQTRKVSAKYETSLVDRNKKRARNTKISTTIERVVEDLISKSMENGEFENLDGKGKPIKEREYNPMVDDTTHRLNNILIEQGFAPNWIMLEKEIKNDISDARDLLLKTRMHCGKEPIPPTLKLVWDKAIIQFKSSIKQTNTKINNYNLQVPGIWQQLMHYNPDREIKKVLEKYKEEVEKQKLNLGYSGEKRSIQSSNMHAQSHTYDLSGEQNLPGENIGGSGLVREDSNIVQNSWYGSFKEFVKKMKVFFTS